MSYLVLARKWRPQTFDQIRGQGHIVRALRNAITSGRIAHAYVFTGIRGVGKTSAARVLAKALNCKGGPTPDPCNACESCREITEGKSPDVLEIDGASNTGVDDVRRLREAVRYPPVRGPYRIYIIDEVHMLSTAAFNALLKTLEEPPPQVVFVFATTDAHKIPLTILSRCQQFDFKRLAPRELVALLEDVAQAEGIAADEKSLAAIAREAEGSVRDAQSLLDQVISYSGEKVTYEDVRDVLGAVDRSLVLSLAQAAVEGDPRRVVERMAEAERFGYDARGLARDLLDVFRDLAVLKALEKAQDLVDLAPEELEEARSFLEGASWESIHALFDILSRGVDAMRTAPRPGLALEMTLLKMAKLPPLLPVSEVMARMKGGGAERSGQAGVDRRGPPRDPSSRSAGRAPDEVKAPAPASRDRGRNPLDVREGLPGNQSAAPPERERPKPSQAESEETAEAVAEAGPIPQPPEMRDPAALWREVLAEAERANRPFWSVLKDHSKLKSWDPEARAAVVGLDDPGHEFFLRSKLDLLAGVLRKVAGPGARVELGRAEARPQGRGPAETDYARDVKRDALKHPLVRDAMEIFDAEIEEVRVLKP